MGRTKSWLALVLAIVMVLGMAVPTAFAAEITGGMSFYDGASAISPVATSAEFPYPLVVNGDSVTVDLHAITAGINLNTRALAGDKAAKIEITNDYDDYVQVTTGDGTITVKPLGNITYATTGFFTVKVSAPEGAEAWGPATTPTAWVKDGYFTQNFYFTVAPKFEVVSPLNLNINSLSDRTKTATIAPIPSSEAFEVTKFLNTNSTTDADWKTADAAFTGYSVAVVTVGTQKYLQVTGTAVGSYDLYVKGKVGGQDVGEVAKIVINVASSSNTDGYAIKLDKTELVVGRRDSANMNVTASIVDANGVVITDAAKSKLGNLTATFTPASGNNLDSEAFDIDDLTNTLDSTTGKFTFAVAGVKPNTKGTLKIERSTSTPDAASAITPVSIPVEIKPIEVTTNPVVSLIKIDLKDDPAYNVYLKANATGAFSALASSVDVSNKIAPQTPNNAAASIAYKKGSASAEGDKGSTTITGKVAGITFKPLTIPYNVIDSTVKPVLTDVGAIELDINPTTVASKPVVLVSASSKTGTVPALTVGTGGKYTKASDGSVNYFDPTPTSSPTPVLTAVASGNIVTVARTTATVPGEYKIPITGTITDVDSNSANLASYTLVVNVKDTTATQVSYFTIDPTSINKKVTDSSFFVSVKAFNAAGTEIKPIPSGAIVFGSIDEDDTYATLGAGTTSRALTIAESGTAGQFTVKTQNPFTGKLSVRGANDVYANATELKTDLVVGGVTVTAAATPALASLDLLSASDVVIKLTTSTGTIAVTDVTATNSANFNQAAITSGGTQVNSGIANFLSSKNEVYLRHATIGKGKLTIKGTVTVDGTAHPFENIVLDYQIKNTRGLVATPAEIKLSLKEGGLKIQNVAFTCNPSTATMILTSVTSNNPAAATVEETSTAGTYKVTAIAKGSGLIIAEGTVGGVAATLTVPFSVDDDATASIVLAVTKTALDLETNKTATASWSVASGTLTEDKLQVVTGTDIVTIGTDGKTITAAKAGTATLKVTGKVNGVAVDSNIVTITVTATPATTAGVYINDVKYESGASFFVPNNFKKNQYKVTLVTADGTVISDVTLKATIAKTAKVRKQRLTTSGAYITPTQTFGKTKLSVTPKAGGNATVIELNVQRLPEVDDSIVTLTTENPQAGTRGYFFDYKTTNTAEAYYTQPKFWNFTTSDGKVAKVKANGIIEFYKAGDVTLKATRKTTNKSKVKSFEFTLKVTDEYLNTASWVAVLSNSTKTAGVLSALNGQSYPKGTTAGVAYEYSKAGYDAMIAYLQTNAKDTDVSAVYIDGAITKNGIALGATTVKLTDLAGDLAQVKGKIFLTLNGAASTLYSSKDADATPADIAKVFAAAEAGVQSKATALSTVGTNGFWSSQKFYVLSATQKKSQASVSATKADAVADAFIQALTLKDGKFFNGGTRVTLQELYTKVKADSKKTIGYYPSAVKGVAVGYYTAPVTP